MILHVRVNVMHVDIDCNYFQNKNNFGKVYMTLLENGCKGLFFPLRISVSKTNVIAFHSINQW